MTKLSRAARLLLAAAALAAPAAVRAQDSAQHDAPQSSAPEGGATPVSEAVGLPEFELGYRFVDVSGNDGVYRSQINDRPGVLLRSLNWASAAPIDGVLDFFRLDANDVGAGPAGALHLAAGQLNKFRLDFSWRHQDFYSALPAFANPLLADGVIPGQHTYNRNREIFDVNLQILPGGKLTPIVGYTQNIYKGPGTTTYTLGQDEFKLDQNIRAKDEEFRIGLAFDLGMFQGNVTQGWRRYRFEDNVTLSPGGGGGNNTFPVLGHDVHADDIARSTENSTDTPTTSIWVSARPLSRLRLVASYVRADADGDTSSVETDAGNFVSFAISRVFASLTDTINSHAETDYWRGSARAEYQLAPGIDVTGGWTERSRDLTGTALATSLFADTFTFGGVSTGDLQQIAASGASLEREDRVFDASVNARMLGPFAVNVGWSQLHQDVTFGSELSSLIEEGSGPGEYTRTVNTYGGGVTFTKWGLIASADYRRDDGNRPILRTDFVNRDRYKLRVGYSFKDMVRIGGTWRESHGNDDASEIGWSTKLRELVGDLDVTLLKGMVTVHASGGEFKAERKILIREPEDFDIVPTFHREMGHTWEGGVTLAWKALSLDGAYLWMQNDGSIPFTVNRTRARAEYFFTSQLGLELEWWWDKYGEAAAFDQAGPLANYNANRYGVFVHWKP